MTTLNSDHTSHKVNLDWIRGLAALAVAMLHCREIGWVGFREFFANRHSQDFVDIVLAYVFAPIVWGSAGVAVFFVLSGYVIHAATARKISGDANWRINIKNFYVRRFVRIYSVLIGAITLTFVLDSMSMHFYPQHPKLGDISIFTFVANIASLQGIFSHTFGSNGPLWTLAIEIHFYAAYPLLLFARRKWSSETLLLSSLVFSLFSYLFSSKIGVTIFASYYFCWVLGFYAAELTAQKRKLCCEKLKSVYAVVPTAIGCAVFFISQYVALICWSLGFFFYLLSVVENPPSNGLLRQVLTRVGTFSYSLYAIHVPIVVFLSSAISSGGKNYSMVVPLSFLLICIGVAYLFYYTIERISIRWLDMHSRNAEKIGRMQLDDTRD